MKKQLRKSTRIIGKDDFITTEPLLFSEEEMGGEDCHIFLNYYAEVNYFVPYLKKIAKKDALSFFFCNFTADSCSLASFSCNGWHFFGRWKR